MLLTVAAGLTRLLFEEAETLLSLKKVLDCIGYQRVKALQHRHPECSATSPVHTPSPLYKL